MRLCSKKLNSTRQRVSVKSEDTNMLKANEHIGKLTSLNYLICYTHTQLDQLLAIKNQEEIRFGPSRRLCTSSFRKMRMYACQHCCTFQALSTSVRLC